MTDEIIEQLATRARVVYDCVVSHRSQEASRAQFRGPDDASANAGVHALQQAFDSLNAEMQRLRSVACDILVYGPSGCGKTFLVNALLRPDGWPCNDACKRTKHDANADGRCPACAGVWKRFEQCVQAVGAPLPSQPGDCPTSMPVKVYHSSRLQLLEWFADGRERPLIDHGQPTIERLLRVTQLLRRSQAQTGAARPQFLVLRGPFRGLATLVPRQLRASKAMTYNVGVVDWPGVGGPAFDRCTPLLEEWMPMVAAVLMFTHERGGRGCTDPWALARMTSHLGLTNLPGRPKVLYVNNDRLRPSAFHEQLPVLTRQLAATWRRAQSSTVAARPRRRSVTGASPSSATQAVNALCIGADAAKASEPDVVVFYSPERLAGEPEALRRTVAVGAQLASALASVLPAALKAHAVHVVHSVSTFLQSTVAVAPVKASSTSPVLQAFQASVGSDGLSPPGSPGSNGVDHASATASLRVEVGSADSQRDSSSSDTEGAQLAPQRSPLDALLVDWCHQHVHQRLRVVRAKTAFSGATGSGVSIPALPDETASRAEIFRAAMADAQLPPTAAGPSSVEGRVLRAVAAQLQALVVRWSVTLVEGCVCAPPPSCVVRMVGLLLTVCFAMDAVHAPVPVPVPVPVHMCVSCTHVPSRCRYVADITAAVTQTGVRAAQSHSRVGDDEVRRVTRRVRSALRRISRRTVVLLSNDLPKLVRDWAQRPEPSVLECMASELATVRRVAYPTAPDCPIPGQQQPGPSEAEQYVVDVVGCCVSHSLTLWGFRHGWPWGVCTRHEVLAAALVSLVTCVDNNKSTKCSCLAARVATISTNTCDAAFRYQLPALLAGVSFNRHLSPSETSVVRNYVKAIRQQALYLLVSPSQDVSTPMGTKPAVHGSHARTYNGAGRGVGAGGAPLPATSGGSATATAPSSLRKSSYRCLKPAPLVSRGNTFRIGKTSKSQLAAAAASAIASFNSGALDHLESDDSDSDDSADRVLAGPHLLRNVSRVSIFEFDDSGSVGSAADAAATATPPLLRCAVGGCQRTTKRSDGLCAEHAEVARALEESDDKADVGEQLVEANVAGGTPEALPDGAGFGVKFRVKMLQWDFVQGKIFEWVIHRGHDGFAAVHNALAGDAAIAAYPAAFPDLPPAVAVATRDGAQEVGTGRCMGMTAWLCAVLKHPDTRSHAGLASFVELGPKRVDEMSEIAPPRRTRSRPRRSSVSVVTSRGVGASSASAGPPATAIAAADNKRRWRERRLTASDDNIVASDAMSGGSTPVAAAAAVVDSPNFSTAVGFSLNPRQSPRSPYPALPSHEAGSAGSLRSLGSLASMGSMGSSNSLLSVGSGGATPRPRARAESDAMPVLHEGLQSSHSLVSETPRDRVIVTLGGPLKPDATPGVWLSERIDAGVALYNRAVNEGSPCVHLVFTGGDCAGLGIAEAEVMRRAAIAKGVPSKRILTDCQAKDTIQNALLVVPLLIRLGVEDVTIVTSEFHVRRSKHYFETIFEAYQQPFSVKYVGVEDYMARHERSLRDRKETLLVRRSQGLLDRSTSEIRGATGRMLGRFSWSFNEKFGDAP